MEQIRQVGRCSRQYRSCLTHLVRQRAPWWRAWPLVIPVASWSRSAPVPCPGNTKRASHLRSWRYGQSFRNTPGTFPHRPPFFLQRDETRKNEKQQPIMGRFDFVGHRWPQGASAFEQSPLSHKSILSASAPFFRAYRCNATHSYPQNIRGAYTGV
jgi:hypothetical protein